MKLIKKKHIKHGLRLEFIEKVQLDAWANVKFIFLAAFAPYQIVVVTQVPDIATSVVPVALVVPSAN